MLLPVFQDLIKPQWRVVIEELKCCGGLPVSELSRKVDASYMAVKQHCEELNGLGYLDRSRVPRTAVGRPEIFYSLSAKADALFPQIGIDFSMALLAEIKKQVGESTPDKILFQYFQTLYDHWQPALDSLVNHDAKLTKLVTLREKFGCFSRVIRLEDHTSIEEMHNPLQRVFEAFPRALAMEVRMIEQLLDRRIVRREFPSGRSGQPRIVFEISARK